MGRLAHVEGRQPQRHTYQRDLKSAIRRIKAERDGEIEVAGPELAGSLAKLDLLDEYRIDVHPVVLGHGKPYFVGHRPSLRLIASNQIDEDVIRLTYVPR